MVFVLPKKTKILWQFRTLFILVVLYGLIVVFCQNKLARILPTSIAMAIGSVFIMVYISFYLKKYKIIVDNSGVTIKKGIIFKTTIIIPYPRLALIKKTATPIMFLLNVRCVMLKVTRGWLFLPELDILAANTLIKMMQNE